MFFKKYLKRITNIQVAFILTGLLFLSAGAQSDNLVLENITINSQEDYTANSITAGPNITISENGDVSFKSNTLAIKPEFFVITGGQFNIISNAVTAVEQDFDILPEEFELKQNFPNPFNPVTRIDFNLPEASFVKIDIFNSLGQKVETLVDENLNVGRHNIIWDAADFSSGVYYYQITAKSFTTVKKMILMK